MGYLFGEEEVRPGVRRALTFGGTLQCRSGLPSFSLRCWLPQLKSKGCAQVGDMQLARPPSVAVPSPPAPSSETGGFWCGVGLVAPGQGVTAPSFREGEKGDMVRHSR